MGWGLIPNKGIGIFLSISTYGVALGTTQPPIQWVAAIIPWGKAARHVVDHSPEIKNV
jgi:hypothetical protein